MFYNFKTLTATEAQRLARRFDDHHNRLGPAFEAGQITEGDWWSPYLIAEALTIFAALGVTPGDDTSGGTIIRD
jgi:hypothetical protein